MVDSTHTHSTADDIGLAVMGVRGLHDLGNIIENDEETEEEKRKREARNTGSALGTVVGIAAGLHLGRAITTRILTMMKMKDLILLCKGEL